MWIRRSWRTCSQKWNASWLPLSSGPIDHLESRKMDLQAKLETTEPRGKHKGVHLGKRIVRRAKKLFQFFLPLQYTTGMVTKYWGAVYTLLEARFLRLLALGPLTNVSRRQRKEAEYVEVGKIFLNETYSIMRLTKAISGSLIQGRGPSPRKISLPNQFGEAWLSLLISLVSCAAKRPDYAQINLYSCEDRLHKGRAELVRMTAPKPLHKKEAVIALGITALLLNNLEGDITVATTDICSTYDLYLTQLVSFHYTTHTTISLAHRDCGCRATMYT